MSYLLFQVSLNANQYDLWRDEVWQAIGTITGGILGLLGLALTVYIFIRQTQKKSLSCELISSSPILKVADDFRNDLEIKFKGKLINSLTLVVVKFFNSGNVPIEQQDYFRPLSLTFNDQAELLSVDVVEEIPSNLGVSFRHDKKIIIIEPLLMNKGDSFTVQALVSQYSSFLIDGRVSGVQRIVKAESQNSMNVWERFSWITATSGMFLALAINSISLVSGFLLTILVVGSPILLLLIWDFKAQSLRKSKPRKNS
jgi:hypothetical protein